MLISLTNLAAMSKIQNNIWTKVRPVATIGDKISWDTLLTEDTFIVFKEK